LTKGTRAWCKPQLPIFGRQPNILIALWSATFLPTKSPIKKILDNMKRNMGFPKSLLEKIEALDDHQFLLRENLHSLQNDLAHAKAISAELRVLACYSSGTEGLLWRLASELGVPDFLELQVAAAYNRNHQLNYALHFATVPCFRPGTGPPEIPVSVVSLKDLIKRYEAIFLQTLTDRMITHEYIIKAVAQQLGLAHEDDHLEPSLFALSKIFINGVHPYIPVLAMDSELVLQISERVLDHASAMLGYRRKSRSESLGNSTLVLRLGIKAELIGTVKICVFKSYVSEAEITLSASPMSFVFDVEKRGKPACQIRIPCPSNWKLREDVVIAFSYASSAQRARAIVSSGGDVQQTCNIGWFDIREIIPPQFHAGREQFVYIQWIRDYTRFLTPKECLELQNLSPELAELFQPNNAGDEESIFPN
jgi:hypothetical protein